MYNAGTVPLRCVTPVVFTIAVLTSLAPARSLGVAPWELAGAVAIGLSLWQETRKQEDIPHALDLD